jgi:anaerobic ribonucleoside-triphosphate reductase
VLACAAADDEKGAAQLQHLAEQIQHLLQAEDNMTEQHVSRHERATHQGNTLVKLTQLQHLAEQIQHLLQAVMTAERHTKGWLWYSLHSCSSYQCQQLATV